MQRLAGILFASSVIRNFHADKWTCQCVLCVWVTTHIYFASAAIDVSVSQHMCDVRGCGSMHEQLMLDPNQNIVTFFVLIFSQFVEKGVRGGRQKKIMHKWKMTGVSEAKPVGKKGGTEWRMFITDKKK